MQASGAVVRPLLEEADDFVVFSKNIADMATGRLGR